jgi:hypothetical protein
MPGLLRYASVRRLPVVLGFALIGLVLAPGASSAAQLDTVSATGSGGIFNNIDISVQSGTSGQNPSGTLSVTAFGTLTFSGSVTCLSVTGPDRGGGSAGAPTTAVVTAEGTFAAQSNVIFTFVLVDNGGGGRDTLAVVSQLSITDCSLPSQVFNLTTLTNGRAIVFDAPLLPTTKEQCKNGGWLNYPQFKNQGDCVSFVETGK